MNTIERKKQLVDQFNKNQQLISELSNQNQQIIGKLQILQEIHNEEEVKKPNKGDKSK